MLPILKQGAAPGTSPPLKHWPNPSRWRVPNRLERISYLSILTTPTLLAHGILSRKYLQCFFRLQTSLSIIAAIFPNLSFDHLIQMNAPRNPMTPSVTNCHALSAPRRAAYPGITKPSRWPGVRRSSGAAIPQSSIKPHSSAQHYFRRSAAPENGRAPIVVSRFASPQPHVPFSLDSCALSALP
jgi:hypothetical protein